MSVKRTNIAWAERRVREDGIDLAVERAAALLLVALDVSARTTPPARLPVGEYGRAALWAASALVRASVLGELLDGAAEADRALRQLSTYLERMGSP